MSDDASKLDAAEALNALRRAQTDLEVIVAARTAELRQTVEQKTALLHEVDHRVKNNLQLIASLMLLQTRRVQDASVKKALGSMLDRINAVATVHRRLFQSDDVAMFDIAAFVHDLADDTLGASRRPDIKILLDTERVQVPAALAAPLALVINELLINAVTHGFPDGRGGEITVSVHCKHDILRIEIADNGVGMLAVSDSSGGDVLGFGLTIVDLLGRQLRARVERGDAGPGVKVMLELPMSGVG
jgi:two-component sensor histidine kinase